MKRYTYIGIVLGAMLLCSCEDYLDKNPESNLSEAEVYSDYDLFKGAVDRISGLLHNYAYSEFDYGGEVGTYSDECQQAYPGHVVLNNVNTGNWQDCGAPGFGWNIGIGLSGDFSVPGDWEFHMRKWTREIPGEASAGIRAANLCIANIDKLEKYPAESIYEPQQLKDQLLGQAYLYRAWFYFELIRLYGGMPNMQEAFKTEEDFDIERPEYWESSKWAAEDANKAIALLPERWALDSELGRPTKTTAKAVKSMILLYQASPNMGIPRDESLSFSGVASYVDSILPKAVAASVDALASALSTSSRYRMYSEEEYEDNFYVNSRTETRKLISDEAVFQAPFTTELFTYVWGSGMFDNQAGTGMYLPWFDGKYDWAAYAVPTHNAVDFFETSDGYELGEYWHLGQGDAVGKSAQWSKDDPYNNRDPRLKKFIFCHGQKMYISDKTSGTAGDNGLGVYLDAREGKGHNEADASKPRGHTGFYIAGKYRFPSNNYSDADFHINANMQISPFIRVAQLYLDLAELSNELYGPLGAIETNGKSIDVNNAVECIRKVRERVGMDVLHEEYYASKERFRDYIRMERARELYFEQHRWQDLRRWRIADKVLPKGIWVADISGSSVEEVKYSKRISEDHVRVFENKHYWYPFMNEDMYLFENFKQNPGW